MPDDYETKELKLQRSAKLRKIGMRLVETCATCKYRVPADRNGLVSFCEKHTYLNNQIQAHDMIVCNSYKANKPTQKWHNINELPIVSTPKRVWVSCTCGWEGWDDETIPHLLSAGGEDMWVHQCPKCQREVAP